MKAAEQLILNGYYEDAVEQYNQALSYEPENGKIYEERAKAYENLKMFENAANDYKKAAVFGSDPAENFYKASQLLFTLGQMQSAMETIGKAIEHRSQYQEAYILQCQIYLALEKYKEAQVAAVHAIDVKSTAYSQYLKGIAECRMGNLAVAEQDLEKAIIKDKMLLEAYLELARIQMRINKSNYALENCNYVLNCDRDDLDALMLRSEIYSSQKSYVKAINDISTAILIDTANADLFIRRGKYYNDFGQPQNAIPDFSAALELDILNKEALECRAEAYEKIGSLSKASSDLSLVLTLYNDLDANEISKIESKIYELNKESDKPNIVLLNPPLNDDLEVLVPEDQESVQINIKVEDASNLQFFRINNDTLVYNTAGVHKKDFNLLLHTKDLDFLTITATDVYNNSSTVSHAVERIETHAPRIILLNPYADDNGNITFSNDDKYLYIEGRVEDESLISSIYVDETTASFVPRDVNPRFTATLDITKKSRINVIATDIHGNRGMQEYTFRYEGREMTDNNPMGKTWVVLIENSEYKEFQNLIMPEKDVQLMQEALSHYKIDKVIVKRNLTKREMERFFSIDLRDLVRINRINSLFIWFAGHGVNNEGVGYWIPSDARMNTEFSYYSINALKASLYSYTTLSHILIVSDACETGSGFCVAMRGPIEEVSCSDTQLLAKKSAQVFTSAGSGYASDNSLFTRSFANALLNNEDDCASIDDIAKRVSLIMQSSSSQKPEFGRIKGIEDEWGSFFFISR
jgi:tetratricopeptide (TPR) repeat protein